MPSRNETRLLCDPDLSTQENKTFIKMNKDYLDENGRRSIQYVIRTIVTL
jgi:hypothetical protein